MSSSNQRPANRGFRSVLRCAISHYRQFPLAVCTRTLDGRLQGRGYYLCRASDSTGATIDFVPSDLRDATAAQRLFRKALTDPSHPQPRVINTDPAHLYGTAISGVKWVTPLLVLRIHHSATTRVVAIANIPAGMNSSRSPISVASTPMA